MNIDPNALKESYRLAWESNAIEHGRLAKALALVERTQCTYVHRHLDGSTIYEYLVPGTDVPWYAVKAIRAVDGKVTIGGHECPDHKHHAGICKHMASVMLAIRAQEIERKAIAQATAPVPVVTTVISPERRVRMLAALYPED